MGGLIIIDRFALGLAVFEAILVNGTDTITVINLNYIRLRRGTGRASWGAGYKCRFLTFFFCHW